MGGSDSAEDVAIASCFRPSQKPFSSQAAEIGTATKAMPVIPIPKNDNNPYDQAPS